MKALVLDKTVELKEVPEPDVPAGQVLVNVRMAGVCNTDLELIKGYMGFRGILGHEFVGVVDDPGAGELNGERVSGEINFGCGVCSYCSKGLSRHCPDRTTLGIFNQNGAFAERVSLPLENLHRIPETISDKAAVFVEPLAAALEIFEQIKIEPDHKVGIVGDGKLGLLIAQVMKLSGAQVILFGRHEHKLRLAQEWGILTRKETNDTGRKFDVVVEVSGSASGFATALSMLRPRGILVLKSTYHGKLELNTAPIVIDEISVVGSRCGPFAPAIRLLERNSIDVESMIDSVYPFADAIEALEHSKERSSLKILMQF